MKNNKDLKSLPLKEMAESWGLNYEIICIKQDLVNEIKKICEKRKISQRQLAKMVDGLTQDRVSKIFSGLVGHMTIDKLISILAALDIKVEIKTKKRRAA